MKYTIRLGTLPFSMYRVWKNSKQVKTDFESIKPKEMHIAENSIIEPHDFQTIKAVLAGMEQERVSIIIPVYNAYNEFKECVQSVIENTTVPYRILIINDGSTDSKLLNYLEAIQKKDNIYTINREENGGYVQAVNVGLQTCNSDVVILNSDTIVTPGWLYKLIVAAYSASDIMTATPVSNAAGAFSVPKMCQVNEIPKGCSIHAMAHIVGSQLGGYYESVPTGNGFCMYVKRKALQEFGLLDEETYGRGYCEENDFCMRMYREGYRNIVCGNTYVFHRCSVSFKQEKQKLLKKHLKILHSRYPEYEYLVEKAFKSDKMQRMRDNIQEKIEKWQEHRDIAEQVLYVGEGMEHIAAKDAAFILNILSDGAELHQCKEGAVEILQKFDNCKEWEMWENVFFSVCYQLHIDKVCIQCSSQYGQAALEVAKWLKIDIEALQP